MSEATFKTLGEIGVFVRGNGLQKKDFVEGGVPCIHYGHIHTHYGTFVERTISFVVPEVAGRLRKAKKGDLIIVCTSENVEDVCKCIAWFGDGDVCVGGETYIFKHNQDTKYLAYYFQTNAFSEFKKKNSTGTKVFRVHESALKDFLIPLPPLEEQKRIAGALSSVDELLASLDKQIAKTRDIKQAAMQQLLTGKIRLAGFPGQLAETKFKQTEIGLIPEGWTSYRIDELFDIGNGYTPSKSNPSYWTNGTIPWFRLEDIRQNGRVLNDSIQHITPLAVKSGKLFPAGSFILSTTATIGEHALLTTDSLANQRFSFLVKKRNCDNLINTKFFLYYMYMIGDWCRSNVNAGGLLAVNMEDLKNYKCAVPPLDEQKRIADVLTSLDDTIEDLEAKRQKYESIKAGMMQQLLTGTIRLS